MNFAEEYSEATVQCVLHEKAEYFTRSTEQANRHFYITVETLPRLLCSRMCSFSSFACMFIFQTRLHVIRCGGSQAISILLSLSWRSWLFVITFYLKLKLF